MTRGPGVALAGLLAVAPAILAQGESSQVAESSRDAYLKGFVNRERGDITALEPSGVSSAVYVGYSSGVVRKCYGESSCLEFRGTSNTAVQHLAISKDGNAEVVWVSYPQGALYRCLDGLCERFEWDGEPAP